MSFKELSAELAESGEAHKPRESSIWRGKCGSFGRSKGDEGEDYHPLNSVLGVTGELDGTCFTRRMREGMWC